MTDPTSRFVDADDPEFHDLPRYVRPAAPRPAAVRRAPIDKRLVRSRVLVAAR